jgi:prepilin-type processing-associated H-X9-DG protein
MKSRVTFSKKDLVVAIACTFFLMLNLGAFDERGRAHAKKMVCLANIRQLAHAWLLYAADNDDKLVNGAIGFSNANMSWGDHTDELAWVDAFSSDPEGTVWGIRDGALWPYLKDYNIYRCPSAMRDEMLTYSIMFSMNAVNHPPTQGVPGAHVKKLTEIQNPEQRLVFIDEGKMTPDAFAVHYDREQWFDGPPIRHSEGTTVSFVDGHSEHWKWNGVETVRAGWKKEQAGGGQWRPETELGCQDLYRIQEGCWSQLGYLPSHVPRH